MEVGGRCAWTDSAHGIERSVFHCSALLNLREKIEDQKMALDPLRQIGGQGAKKNEIG